MTESIFSAFGADAATVETDPFKIPRNKYNCTVTGAEVKNLKGIDYFMVELTITGDSDQVGKTVDNMLRIQPWTDAERATQGDAKTMNARTIGSYKKALLELGIREEALNGFNPRTMGGKLLGIKGVAEIGPNNKGYNNVFSFERPAVSTPTEVAQAESAVSSPQVDASALDDLMSGLN
jgi:hypothetical protein